MRSHVSFALSLVVALSATLAGGVAEAGIDLGVAVTQAPNALVYQSSRYTVRVTGVGSTRSYPPTVTIQLPVTHTSPTVYVLGTVGAMASGCTRTGTRITCVTSTRLRRNDVLDFYFDLAVPQNSAPVEVTATVASTLDANAANDRFTAIADVDNVNHVISTTAESDVHNSHCTGRALTSYYECVLTPSSVSSHDVVFHANGTLSIPSEGPTYGGVWAQPNDNLLTFTYTESGNPIAQFVGASVHNAFGTCFEGIVSFPGSTSGYVSPYRVCVTPR